MATKMINENNSKTSASRKPTPTNVSVDAEAQKSEKPMDKGKTSARAGVSSQNSENVRPTQTHAQGQGSHAQTQANKGAVIPPSVTGMNKEMISILREMNTNISKQGEKLETLTNRVDSLYNDYEYQESDYSYDCYDEAENEVYEPVIEGSEETASVSIEAEENPKKKQKTGESVFAEWIDKFKATEKTDAEVNDSLAEIVNNAFRTGLSDLKLEELLKDIHRPENCFSLVKTRVNPCVWRLLKSTTQTEDSKMQAIQNLVIKGSANIAKLLDKEGEAFDGQSFEWAANALALFGHSTKLINNKRKEIHKADIDPKYHPLMSASLAYTNHLYGEDMDINKNVKDIRDMSKVGRAGVGQKSYPRGGYHNYNRRRGGRRGPYRPYGRGRSGGRFSQDRYQNSYSTAAESKNSRGGHKK